MTAGRGRHNDHHHGGPRRPPARHHHDDHDHDAHGGAAGGGGRPGRGLRDRPIDGREFAQQQQRQQWSSPPPAAAASPAPAAAAAAGPPPAAPAPADGASRRVFSALEDAWSSPDRPSGATATSRAGGGVGVDVGPPPPLPAKRQRRQEGDGSGSGDAEERAGNAEQEGDAAAAAAAAAAMPSAPLPQRWHANERRGYEQGGRCGGDGGSCDGDGDSWLARQLERAALELGRAAARLDPLPWGPGGEVRGSRGLHLRRAAGGPPPPSIRHQHLYLPLLGILRDLEPVVREALPGIRRASERRGEREGGDGILDAGYYGSGAGSAPGELAAARRALEDLADRLVALLVRLPADDAAAVAVLGRAAGLWVLVARARRPPLGAAVDPEQWGLLLDRLAAVSSAAAAADAASSSSSFGLPPADPAAFVECAGSWVPVLLAAWPPPLPPPDLARAPPGHRPRAAAESGPRSQHWWLDRARCLLPAASASLAGSDWREGLDLLIRGPEEDGRESGGWEGPEQHPAAAAGASPVVEPGTAADSYPLDLLCAGPLPRPLAVAVAYRALTTRVLERAAAATEVPSSPPRDVPMPAASAGDEWRRYAEELASHALEVAEAVGLVLDSTQRLPDERNDNWNSDADANEQDEREMTCGLARHAHAYNTDGRNNGFSQPDGGEPAAHASATAEAEAGLAAAAFAVEHLDAAFRTARAVEALWAAGGGAKDEGRAQARLGADRALGRVHLPLWESASALALSSPLSSRHGTLLLAMARRVLAPVPLIDTSTLPPWSSPRTWAAFAEFPSSFPALLVAAVECWNTTLLRVCSDGPHWLLESNILDGGPGTEDSADNGDDDADGPNGTLEDALSRLAAWSPEVRHVLQVAALNLSDAPSPSPRRLASSENGDGVPSGSSSATERADAASSAPDEKRLVAVALARVASSCSDEPEEGDEKADDPWSRIFSQMAHQRGLLVHE